MDIYKFTHAWNQIDECLNTTEQCTKQKCENFWPDHDEVLGIRKKGVILYVWTKLKAVKEEHNMKWVLLIVSTTWNG